MKAFIFGYQTNYDLGACIVYAETKENAIELAKDFAWDTHNIHEIDTTKYSNKLLMIQESDIVVVPKE